jgi:hypothetical protein
MPGIQVVKNRLAVQGDGKPRLMVHVDAANTLADFEQYQWLENRDGLRDQPRKTNDHAMDALRYAAMGVDEGWVSGYGAYYEGTNPRAIAGRY